jgi:hypothetical protein
MLICIETEKGVFLEIVVEPQPFPVTTRGNIITEAEVPNKN